jgi:hypothetical protein
MKAENDTTWHSRDIRISDIPVPNDRDLLRPTEIVVTIDYLHSKDEAGMTYKAVALDGTVIPHLIRCVNSHEVLVANLSELVRLIESFVSGELVTWPVSACQHASEALKLAKGEL